MGLEMRWPEDKQKSSCRRKTGRLGSSAVQVPAPGLRLDSGDSSAAESGVQGGGGGQR